MVLHYLWLAFFFIGFASAIYQYFGAGNVHIFEQLVKNIFDTASLGVTIALGIVGVMTLFLGMMNIGEKAGIVQKLSHWVYPFFSKLFPRIAKGEPVLAEMMMNFAANFLGLDNAATPFGLKAMKSLQARNPHPDKASDEQIMFVVLHSSGLTIIPISILAQRVILGSHNPASIFVPTLITTFVATMAAVIIVGIRQKINLFHRSFLYVFAFFALLVTGVVFFISRAQLTQLSSLLGNLIILLIFAAFMLFAARRKVNVYDSFIEGAKNGFNTSVRIIPYLVGMLVVIGIFRTSGALDMLLSLARSACVYFHFRTDYIDALPVALLKPLSGSGARAMMLDVMQHHGADSFTGQLACIFQGSSDTTFYVVALYFGVAGVRNVRYSVSASLLADAVGIITALFIAHLFFG